MAASWTFPVKLVPRAQLLAAVRHGHHIRGKPPGVAKTLQQKLEELNAVDPTIAFRVDIGLPKSPNARSEETMKRIQHVKKLKEEAALSGALKEEILEIDLNAAHKDWLETVGPNHIKRIADHYGVFQDLFGDAYFTPRSKLLVAFEKGDLLHPVFYGNRLKPLDVASKPKVKFESDEKSLWTLALTNPDGHLEDSSKEYVHWLIGNIPGGDLTKGDVIFDYMQPFPVKGTGYHRLVFVLYKQDKPIDYSALKKSSKEVNLDERTFTTLDFYRERQDEMTPAGLAFFQADWDDSVSEFFHKTLKMKEPIYTYDHLPQYFSKQKWFPLKRAFNTYLEMHKHPQDLAALYFKKKLKNIHPFKPPPPPLPYPNAQPLPKDMPTWLRLQTKKDRLGVGKISEV